MRIRLADHEAPQLMNDGPPRISGLHFADRDSAQAFRHICQSRSDQVKTDPCTGLFSHRGTAPEPGFEIVRQKLMRLPRSCDHPLLRSHPKTRLGFAQHRLTRTRDRPKQVLQVLVARAL